MPGLNPTPQDFEQFFEITGADYNQAVHFLENGTSVQGAIEDYFAAKEAGSLQPGETAQSDDEDDEAALEEALDMSDEPLNSAPQQPSQPAASASGPRTLGGVVADWSLPESWGQPERRMGGLGGGSGAPAGRRPGEVATLFNSGIKDGAGPSRQGMPGAFGGGGDDDDDDDEDDDERKGEKELYAGGEKSGLAIENPNQGGGGGSHKKLVSDILKQAAEGGSSRSEAEASSSSSTPFFRGSGNTLGSDETPSAAIPDPSRPRTANPTVQGVTPGFMDRLLGRGAPAPPSEDEEPQVRQLTFWRDGFSIEDGPLMEYSNPRNKELLNAIQAGRAPPSLFNVRYDQPLQVEVAQRTNEDYVPQPKKVRTFGGEGNRLGSPAPEVRGSGSNSPVPGILQGGSSSTNGSASGSGGGSGGGLVSQGAGTGNTPAFQVDETKPTTSIQIRLADGSKMVAKVNLTHKVQDLINFVSAARPDSRSFVLQTTFPSKLLDQPEQTIEDAGLKNAVVVQRFN